MKNKLKKFISLLLTLDLLLAHPWMVLASAQGPLDPGTSAGAGVTGCTNAVNWADTGTPGNASANDTSYITITGGNWDNAETSDELRLSNFGFGINSPNDVIDGIIVETLGWAPAGSANYTKVQLFTAPGTNVGNNKAQGAFDTSDPGSTYTVWGGPRDLWNATSSWTPTIINSSNFGFVICFTASAANSNLNVDHIRITVYYSAPARHIRLFRSRKLILHAGSKLIIYGTSTTQ